VSADAGLLPLEQKYPQYAVGTLDVTYSAMQKEVLVLDGHGCKGGRSIPDIWQ